jgi:hypothetical protein
MIRNSEDGKLATSLTTPPPLKNTPLPPRKKQTPPTPSPQKKTNTTPPPRKITWHKPGRVGEENQDESSLLLQR